MPHWEITRNFPKSTKNAYFGRCIGIYIHIYIHVFCVRVASITWVLVETMNQPWWRFYLDVYLQIAYFPQTKIYVWYIWVNFNFTNLKCWAILGWFPLLTMIPVRENSEVVTIYPDVWYIYMCYNYYYYYYYYIPVNKKCRIITGMHT